MALNGTASKTVALVRRGFPSPRLASLSPVSEVSYALGSSFGLAWSKARSVDADFILLVDDAAPLDVRLLGLLQRILAANASMHGITLGADALKSVYALSRPRAPRGNVPLSAHPVSALPSWLALLRRACWPDAASERTPEFFLLRQVDTLRTFQTLSPSMDFDSVAWAGALVSHAAAQLAADYADCGDRAVVPPQFRVEVPGSSARLPIPPSSTGPLFTVVMPSIRPDFLREAVDSVVHQSFPDWELRIGIDGPKEIQRQRIAQVLNEYLKDPRIHVRYFKHSGTGPIRRQLSEHARGRYITTLDDDDRFSPTALERFARAIDEAPEIPLLRGGARVFGLLDTHLSPRRRYRIDGIPNDLFEVTQPYVVRRDTLQALHGFEWDPGLKNAGEDSDLLLKADREDLPVLLIDEPLYERRLSTLNQTLDCTAEECLRHVENLYDKHDPPGWSLSDVQLSGSSSTVDMRTVHVNAEREAVVVCATQFMNFQQVGSRDGVVIDLEVTARCNAVCSFCPREHLERSQRYIALDVVRKLASHLAAERRPTVVLCGIGESTLHPELGEIVRTLAAAGVNVCMTTNGWNLSPELVDGLVAQGLCELNVSLNANSAGVHAALMRLKTFDTTAQACREIAAVRHLRWPNLELHVSFVLTADNEHEAEAFVDAWDRDGISQIWFHPLTNRAGLLAAACRPHRLLDLAERFAAHRKVVVDLFPESAEGAANLCRVAQNVDFISVEGDLLLCAQDYRATHRFGNLGSASISELHQAKVLQHLRGATAKTCSACSFCPRGFKGGSSASYTIVQAGAC